MNMKNLEKLSAMLLEENAGKFASTDGNASAREAGRKATEEAESQLKDIVNKEETPATGAPEQGANPAEEPDATQTTSNEEGGN
jgi:hypothetical protein